MSEYLQPPGGGGKPPPSSESIVLDLDLLEERLRSIRRSCDATMKHVDSTLKSLKDLQEDSKQEG